MHFDWSLQGTYDLLENRCIAAIMDNLFFVLLNMVDIFENVEKIIPRKGK